MAQQSKGLGGRPWGWGWVWTLIACASLLLHVLVAMATIRSYFVTDRIWYQPPRLDRDPHQYIVAWGKGYFAICAAGIIGREESGLNWQTNPWPSRLDGSRTRTKAIEAFGVRVLVQPSLSIITPSVTEVAIYMPAWVPLLLTAVLPLVWLRQYHHRTREARRLAAGQCVQCGYDLRATPGRCPECGAKAIPVKS